MPARLSQWDSLLIPIIQHHFDVGMNKVPSMRRRLFNVQRSTLAEEKGTGFGGMSPDVWSKYKDSGTKGELSFDQLYTQTYVHEEYPARFRIQKKLLINDQYGVIRRYIQKVGISAEQKMELDAASLLNNAFASGSKWSDGKPLCSTTHPKAPSDKKAASVYSNSGTKTFTKDHVSEVRIEMMRFKDDKGNEIGIMPNELWVPPELEDTALEIVRSAKDPDTPNNAINPQAGRWTVIPWLRLTDTTAWFMADGMWRNEMVNWYVREVTSPMLVYEDTTDLVYEVKLHYSYGVDDWRWLYGNNP